jgi:cytidylate kinase
MVDTHSVLIAFSGKIGTGKSSISKAVATKLGWPWVSFGEYVRQIAAKQGLEPTRLTWQTVGEALLLADEQAFCKAVLEQAPYGFSNIVVDGVRHKTVLESLQKIMLPGRLLHIHLLVDEVTRVERILQREGNLGLTELNRADLHPTEQQVAENFISSANAVLNSSLPPEQLIDEVIALVNKY